MYGTRISAQQQPVLRTGTAAPILYGTLNTDRSTGKHIAEVNRLPYGNINFEPNVSYTTGTSTQVKLQATSIAQYIMTGDFTESPLTGTITGSVDG
jgi:hypothetical protein